jgi:glycosyltransferase involved in cell wall biosynthesis
MLSFVVPAHNEEEAIAATLAAIAAAAQALSVPFETIVVDDASTDATAALAAEGGARVVSIARRQISAARNAGASAAQGSILVFVDADTLVTREVVQGLLAVMDKGAIGGGAGVRFDDPVPAWVKILLPLGLWLARRARLAAGCFLFCDVEVFRKVGGFSEEVFAGEEIFLSRVLQGEGAFVILRETVLTSGRKLRTYSAWDLLRMTARLIGAGRTGLREREGLGLWYGPRRLDPRSDPHAVPSPRFGFFRRKSR